MLSTQTKNAIYATYSESKQIGRNFEIETRFGSYERLGQNLGNQYRLTVSLQTFNQMKRRFKEPPIKLAINDLLDDQGNRMSVTHDLINDPSGKNKTTIWINKQKSLGKSSMNTSQIGPYTEDYPNYKYRIAISYEQQIRPITNFRPTKARSKTRYSFPMFGGVCRLDLTEVYTQTSGETPKPEYEVELELTSDNISDVILENYDQAIRAVLRAVHDTYLIYTYNEYLDIVSRFNTTLNGGTLYDNKINGVGSAVGSRLNGGKVDNDIYRYTFDSRVLYQPRNLHFKDLVWGGLVGNPKTTYTVTHKTDGIRKILICTPNQIWLIWPPYQADKIFEYTNEVPQALTQISGAILEGELIPDDKEHRRNGAPTSPYWFWAFDCLSRPVRQSGNLNGSADIQQFPHVARMVDARYVTAAIGSFPSSVENPLLITNAKSFLELHDSLIFFARIRELEEEKSNLPYVTDGYIFTAENMPYNSGNDKIPLKDRVLTRYADICKWKPQRDITIDFAFFRGPEGISLMTGVGYGQLKKFTGSDRFPFSGTRISDTELSRTFINGTIVEYEYDSTNNTLIPRGTRSDKTKPNREEFALDNWDLAHQPITLNTLKGDTLDLLRAYHNNIKRDLYNSAYRYFNPIVPTTSFARNTHVQTPGPPQTQIMVVKGVITTVTKPTKTTALQNPANLIPVNLLDIGSGMGGDVYKWSQFNKIIAVEPDRQHIDEMIRRITGSFKQASVFVITNMSDVGTMVQQANAMSHRVIVVQTGGENHQLITTVREQFFGGVKADVISLMLSLSFFWRDADTLNSLVQTIVNNISPSNQYKPNLSGQIIFFTIDGDSTLELFAPALQNGYPITAVNSLLYEIKLTNRVVTIHIKNSIVDNQTEWLVHLDDLMTRLNTYNLQLRDLSRADKQGFLNPMETILTRLYTAGRFVFGTQVPMAKLQDTTAAYNAANSLILNSQKSIQQIEQVHETPTLTSISIPTRPTPPVIPSNPVFPTYITSPPNVASVPVVATVPTRPTSGVSFPVPTTPLIITTTPVPITPPVPISVPTPITPVPVPITFPLPIPAPITFNSSILPLQINSNELPYIPVYYDPLSDKGIGDGTYQQISCSWYTAFPVVRIGCIGDGSCFFHAVLQAYLPEYTNNPSYRFRTEFVEKFRRDLAAALQLESEPGKTYYETAADGSWVNMATFQKGQKSTDEVGAGVDYSLEGMQELLNSKSDVGNEVYQYVSDMIGVDIYVMLASKTDLTRILSTHKEGRNRPGVFIAGNGYHYEVIAVDFGPLVSKNPASGFQTMFMEGDGFLMAFRAQELLGDAVSASKTIKNQIDLLVQHRVSVSFLTYLNNLDQTADQLLTEIKTLVSQIGQGYSDLIDRVRYNVTYISNLSKQAIEVKQQILGPV